MEKLRQDGKGEIAQKPVMVKVSCHSTWLPSELSMNLSMCMLACIKKKNCITFMSYGLLFDVYLTLISVHYGLLYFVLFFTFMVIVHNI